MRSLKNNLDFFHIRLGLDFLQDPRLVLLEKIANSQATDYLFRYHSFLYSGMRFHDRFDFTQSYLTTVDFDTEKTAIKNLDYIENSLLENNKIFSTLKSYFPASYKFSGKIFITCGYDSSTSFQNNISINPGHDSFRKDALKLESALLHELCCCAFASYQPVPDGSKVRSCYEILDFVRFHTQAEGMALFISGCLSEFRGTNFDGSDEKSVETFLSVCDDLQNYGRQTIADDDWFLFDKMSSLSGIWHKAGALMAKRIFERKGNQVLAHLVEAGPEAFVAEYISIANEKKRKFFA